MKNKTVKIICIFMILVFFILLLIIPKVSILNDGGTKIYKSCTYEITKVHKIKEDSLNEFYEGTIVKIFGKEVYNDVPKNVQVFNDGTDKNDIKEYNSYILNWDSYGSWDENIDKVIISNTDELQRFCIKLENEDESFVMVDRINRSTDLFKKYDEEYFKNNSLAILGVDLGNGSEYIDLKKATKENNNVRIDYEIAFSSEVGITVMRKCFIVVEIDKNITGITENCLNKEYSFTDVSLSLKPDTLTSKGATFVIKNNSNEPYLYGADYKIEIKKDGQWQDIELKEPLVWNSLAYKLIGRGQQEINIDFSYGYGELSKGKYRLVKKVFRESDTPIDETKYQNVYEEFEIL